MEEQFSELYDKAAVVRGGVFCFVFVTFALDYLVGFYHLEPFLRLNELLISILLCFVAYALSVAMTLSVRHRLSRFISEFTAVSGLGSILLGIAMAAFLYVDTLVDLQNYRETPGFWMSGTPPRPVLPGIVDLLVYGAGFAATSFMSANILHLVFRSSRN